MIGIAVDPGTKHIGYTIFSLENEALTLFEYGHFKPKNGPLEQRLYELFRYFQELLDDSVDVLVTENIFSNPRFPSGIVVREVLGILKVVAYGKGISVVLLRPEDPKLVLTGKRNSNKLQVAEKIEEMNIPLPLPAKELADKGLDHITDSLAMAIAYGVRQFPEITILDQKGEKICSVVGKNHGKNGKLNTDPTVLEKTDGKKEKAAAGGSHILNS